MRCHTVMLGRPVGLSILRVLGVGLSNTHPMAGNRAEGPLEDQPGGDRRRHLGFPPGLP